MLITEANLRRIVRCTWQFLQDKKVKSPADLMELMNIPFITNEHHDHILIDMMPSNQTTFAYILGYIIPGKETPLEIKINEYYKYSRLLVKAGVALPEYKLFGKDKFGNVWQERVTGTAEMSDVQSELAWLANFRR